MTPAERNATVRRALDKFQAELTASAPHIAKIMGACERGWEPLEAGYTIPGITRSSDGRGMVPLCWLTEDTPAGASAACDRHATWGHVEEPSLDWRRYDAYSCDSHLDAMEPHMWEKD
jgi:hypothetical protein